MKDKFINMIEEILDMEESLDMNAKFREFEEWDSLAYLSVIAGIDETFGLVIPRDKFREMSTFNEVLDYVEKNHK